MTQWIVDDVSGLYSHYSTTLAAPLVWNGASELIVVPARPAGSHSWSAFRQDINDVGRWMVAIMQRRGLASPARDSGLRFNIEREAAEVKLKVSRLPLFAQVTYTFNTADSVALTAKIENTLPWSQLYWIQKTIAAFIGLADSL